MFTMFELDFRNIIVLVSLMIHASLLWVLYRYGRKTPSGRAYSIAILAIVGWIFPMALYRSHLFGETLLWARMLYIMSSFTSTSFLYFTFVFPDNKKPPIWLQIFLFVENILIVLLCLHPSLMIKGIEFSTIGEDKILWGPLYFVFANHISLLFLAGFIILFLKWRKATGIDRQQILYILIGYFLGANLAMVTNLILPWFGYFELNWLGQFFSTLVAVFTTYAILKHQLLNVKLIATEGFLIILNLFISFQLITASSIKQLFVALIVWLAVLVISYLLMRSVKQEINRREEVTALAQSLEQANLQLREVDRQKTEFLSIAAHQLRTPLSIIKGYISLIQEGAYGKPTKKMVGILDNIDKSNEHLVKLIDEFLNITRIEQGRTKYNFAEFNINEIIKEAVDELQAKANEKKLKIHWENNNTIDKTIVDNEKIRHVIYNFIDNAIKYTDQDGIEVSFVKEDKGLVFRVQDHGIGFEKVDQANFFQKFYRGQNVKDSNVTGTGLGLYVCRKFIEGHNGKVWAKSDGLDKGSEFGFWIPEKQVTT